MPVVLARVDQRLIHGLIVNQWAQSLNAKRFMVVDDVVSQNEDLKASMRMSKPAGTGMSIINTEKAITNFNNGNYDAQRVFVLVKEPSKLLELIDAGIKIPKVNLGIMFAEDGRTPLTKFVALNDQEKADIKKIQDKGVPVTIQYVPADPEEDINKYLK
ncbi:PTS sugar transporter subunit IIB [Pediococcus inopinatus]|uniref:PTS sugar transporter subunit IIB n=1 Tax=Pediococcus inopinatus TaxID=114090 RepID=A0ABZ0Q5F9_9LACO|nr:PTS sugar transporter subunit IIB [Pediococcus inopinatus]AVL00723.1 PTS mannose/fructose/sorbose transporter subunit IIB [Pediococcus inopinatus]KRN57090.1 PTS family mannose fructose sorbose porter component IIB [Pediococcus inopinatus]WPC16962.1 PTS sugar transporter subunit IIB [Pediococcus inopinatus]WPC19919.1 PTS sugar transporter subunit IIB [Pediococcus inopinatus]WPC21619.1 PTS sugar transporter subunit IIB [Pediococcus inopinatus]